MNANMNKSLDDIIKERKEQQGKNHIRNGHPEKQSGEKRRRESHQGPFKVARRIYVGNLSWKISWQDLKDFFKDCGEVLFADVLRFEDGRSKGCGIVEFLTQEEAAHAINTLHNAELDGREIFLREDRDDFELTGRKGAKRTRGPITPEDSATQNVIFVGNLLFETTPADLEEHFRQCGEIESVEIIQDPRGRSKGCGLVSFQESQDAEEAIRTLDGTSLGGRKLHVRADNGGAQGITKKPGDIAGTRIYVHNLNYRTSWQALKDHFKQAGEVLHADILQEPSGRSKGCGIVQFATSKAAQEAIETLNESILNERQVRVREDREQ